MPGKSVETIRLLGGHPALDFVNTVDSRRDRWGPDSLVTYGDALRWAVRTGVIEPVLERQLSRLAADDGAGAREALGRLKEAREAFYEVFLATAEARSPATRAVAVLVHFASTAAGERRLLFLAEKFVWTWRDEGLDAILHRLSLAAADLLVEAPERRRIGACPGRHCGWLFLDTSPTARRRWCSAQGCGTSERVRRFRAKSGGSRSGR